MIKAIILTGVNVAAGINGTALEAINLRRYYYAVKHVFARNRCCQARQGYEGSDWKEAKSHMIILPTHERWSLLVRQCGVKERMRKSWLVVTVEVKK